jgi:tRNA threonylcarbamoyladenosine biosynthesis protein TsaE
VVTKSVASTQKLAKQFAAFLRPGTVVALNGDLGAGKTTFVQGMAQGLGVEDWQHVTSPTYNIANSYHGARCDLVHVDFYRLGSAQSVYDLGLAEEIARQDAVIVIEWAKQFPELLPPDAIWLEIVSTPYGRKIKAC